MIGKRAVRIRKKPSATKNRLCRAPAVSMPESAAGEILSWDEVSRTHAIRKGVYQRGGRLVSLLTDFGRINPCYPDRPVGDTGAIHYTGEGRRGDQLLTPGNRALLAAIESGHSVPLFNKLAAGCWQHLGFWRVVAGEQRFDTGENRMLWWFTLKRTQSPGQLTRRMRRGPGPFLS